MKKTNEKVSHIASQLLIAMFLSKVVNLTFPDKWALNITWKSRRSHCI